MNSETPAISAQPNYADIPSRLKAGLFDWCMCVFFLLGIFFLVAIVENIWFYRSTNALQLIACWLYFSLYESSASGATPGKKRYQLRVSDADGNRITFKNASFRFVGKLIVLGTCLIPLLVAYFEKQKRGIEDFMAGTVVTSTVQPIVVSALNTQTAVVATTAEDQPGKVTITINESEAVKSGGHFFLKLLFFIAASYVAHHFVSGNWNTPADLKRWDFPVLLVTEGQQGPSFRSVNWYALKEQLKADPESKLNLPPGHHEIDRSAEVGDTDVLSFDVISIQGGIQVELSHRDGSKAVEATYKVIGDSVQPLKMHMWNPFSLFAALLIGVLATALFGKLLDWYL